MGTSWPEIEKPSSSHRERVMKELVEGRDFATQLKNLLQNPFDGHGSALAGELVVKILNSFTQTLSALTCCESSEVNSQNPATSFYDDSPCVDDRRSEDSGYSRKRPASKDRRGCYKRKKNSQTWTTVSATVDDGHAWRKYGQKSILNAKYPRNYFRCTRKYEQGCKATKQVQKMEDDSQMYHTTYIGVHTCKDAVKAPQIISTDSNPNWESFIVCSSNCSKIPSEQHIIMPIVKQESKVETSISDITDNNISAMDSITWKDLMNFESADAEPEPAMLSPNMRPDYGDTVSSADFFDFDDTEFLLNNS